MIFSVWMLVLAVFLSAAVAGVFTVLVIGIRKPRLDAVRSPGTT